MLFSNFLMISLMAVNYQHAFVMLKERKRVNNIFVLKSVDHKQVGPNFEQKKINWSPMLQLSSILLPTLKKTHAKINTMFVSIEKGRKELGAKGK